MHYFLITDNQELTAVSLDLKKSVSAKSEAELREKCERMVNDIVELVVLYADYKKSQIII